MYQPGPPPPPAPYAYPPAPSPDPNAPSCLAVGLFVLGVLGIGAVTLVGGPVAWAAREVAVATGARPSAFVEPLIAFVQALVIGVPAGLAAAFVTAPRYRAAFRLWTGAAVALAVLGLARAMPHDWIQPLALTQAAICLLGALGLRRLARQNGPAAGGRAGIGLALAVGVLAGLPWLPAGALGSFLDTLCTALAGISLGLLAGGLCRVLLLPTLEAHSSGPALDTGFGGVAVAAMLLILTSGFAALGQNLLLLFALPPLGFAVRAAAYWAGGAARAWGPMAALLGTAAAIPLMLWDPAELTLLLSNADDIPARALGATALAWLWASALSLVVWALQGTLRPLAARLPGRAIAAGALLLAVLAYAWLGQPGLYGDRLFVIMRDQADVSAASQISDRDERLRSVYATLTTHATQSQADVRRTLDGLGIHYRPYYLVNALEVDADGPLRFYLASRSDVDRVIASPHLRPLPAPPRPDTGSATTPPDTPDWNITSIGADRVWADLHVRGDGIVIGESDSGVDGAHPALHDGYRGRTGGDDYNWLDPWYGSTTPVDYGGHGTHTLGSALGRTNVGVAPGAQWMGCVNLARNLGNPPAYLDCLQFMLAPYPPGQDSFTAGDPSRAAHVLNNSWGCPPEEGCDPSSLLPAARALRAAGIFVVVSAGNDGPACGSVQDPLAIYDDVFSVGAVNKDGNVTSFSSRGPVEVDGSGRIKPDIVAPGEDVLSSLPHATYGQESGTSMAGPHVAGVVALMWSANPRLIGDIDRTTELLEQTARPYTGDTTPGCFAGSAQDNDAYGFGVVDAYAAVQAAIAAR